MHRQATYQGVTRPTAAPVTTSFKPARSEDEKAQWDIAANEARPRTVADPGHVPVPGRWDGFPVRQAGLVWWVLWVKAIAGITGTG
jgi:hypothetical protein